MNAVCPACSAPRTSDGQFCEACGFDVGSGVAPTRTKEPVSPGIPRWEITVTADRSYYERLAPAGVPFPANYPPRTFKLEGEEIRVGRNAHSHVLGVNLSGSPEDPGISRLHMLLVRSQDGCYQVMDPGSTNGTTLNDDERPLALNLHVRLIEGDRIHIGAWTTIIIGSSSGLPGED